jgi:fibro-slime domain-containing protein
VAPRVGSVRLGFVFACSFVVVGACSTYTADPGGTGGSAGSTTGATDAGGTNNGATSNGGNGTGDVGPIDIGGGNEGGCDPGTDATCGLSPEDLGFCSDGQQDPGEACDDGNALSGDGCTATCAQVEGDFVCPTPGEMCVSTQKCGDKKISSGETCDDGQATPKSKDGCDANCQREDGWVCVTPGQPCQAAKCGDKIIAGNEQCDDGNGAAADGCSDTCQIEDGFVCPTVGAACKPTVCGDGKREGSEPCDDGNQVIGDGCTTLCQVEANCPKTGGACTSRCGDGLLLPADDEECDDGNVVDGDGCSAKCTIEPGYACPPVQGELPAAIQLPFVYRDFMSRPAAGKAVPRHPDFNGGCRGLWQEGIVNDVLDAQGKPSNSHLCDLPAAPTCTVNTGYVALTQNDFCHRFDDCGGKEPTGCLGMTHANHPIASHPTEDPFKFWYRDTPDVNKTFVQTVTLLKNAQGVYTYNAPAAGLFPIDGMGWVATGDEGTYSYSGNPPLHNFGFTTEIRYWFQFKGGETLTFSGDDDVWVFVNGKLALDMGGKHAAGSRTIVLNANGTGTCAACPTVTRALGITVGNVYEIALFHAERQTAASNFALSLTGFFNEKSQCKTVCGDGVVMGNEECDDGEKKNGSGAYGGCTADCKRGSYCGDGTVDKPDEDCDNSVNTSKYGGCAPGCKAGPFCGDKIVQSQFEECDDGVFAGEYGGCAENCKLGPRCGDKIVQKDGGEECDDGNHVNLDGCTANCRIEVPK